MKHKLPPTEFGKNKDNPFDGDLLNRKEEIENLTPMIKNLASPTVMALNAPWGAGKTAFVKMWAGYLVKKQIPALYFNAWETDYAPDPFVPFVETLTEQLPGGNRRKLIKNAKALAPIIGGVVCELPDVELWTKLPIKVANAIKGLFASHGELIKFKNNLGEFVKSQKGNRIVVFVDELDRCRPDYAVKVLERIKHLFEVPGLIFVLATNREQLCHSVKALYGAEIDADTYLQRFIDFDFTIEQPKMDNFIASRLENMEVRDFLDNRESPHNPRNDHNNLYETLIFLARIYKYSLRDAEQLLTRVVLVLRALKDDDNKEHYFYPVLLAFLLAVRLKARHLYDKYILPDNNEDEMVAYWEEELKLAGYKSHLLQTGKPSIADRIKAHIVMAKVHDRESRSPLHKIGGAHELIGKNRTKFGGEEHLYRLLTYGMGFRMVDSRFGPRIDLSRLVKKIEMLDKFNFPTNDNPENKNN